MLRVKLVIINHTFRLISINTECLVHRGEGDIMKQKLSIMLICVVYILSGCNRYKDRPLIPNEITFDNGDFFLEYHDRNDNILLYKNESGKEIKVIIDPKDSKATLSYHHLKYVIIGNTREYSVEYPDGSYMECKESACTSEWNSSSNIDYPLINRSDFIFEIIQYYNYKPISLVKYIGGLTIDLLIPLFIIFIGYLSYIYPENVHRFPRIFWHRYKEPPKHTKEYISYVKIVAGILIFIGFVQLIDNIVKMFK